MNPISESSPRPDRFFVYGTLCRGQCRERCWPVPPIEVARAWTFGTLFDRADYPAMRPGNDRVVGECWRFAPEQIDEILVVLDQIEGTDQPGSANLYDRVVTEVYRLETGVADPADAERIGIAWGYHYSMPPERDGFVCVVAGEMSFVRWPVSS